MKIWLPLLLLALTACAPTVHVVEAPKNPTFADVDVCTLLKDGDVEAQKLTSKTATGKRSCEFAFGQGEGAVSVEVTLRPESYQTATAPFCKAGEDGSWRCPEDVRATKYNGRSIVHKCEDTAGSMRCEAVAQVSEEKSVALEVKRSPDSADALGRLTDSIAQKLLNQRAVTS